MKRTDFDDYKETYKDEVASSIAFIGQDVEFFTKAKAHTLLHVAARLLGDTGKLKVLDIGCGVGSTDRYLIDHFGELHGVDVADEVIEKAKLAIPAAHYQDYDGKCLPFADDTFDLAFAINVMHHVPPADWQNFAVEMRRVLRPGGIALVFEHNPYNPLTRRAVSNCAFDADAVLLRRRVTLGLFAKADLIPVESRYILFFPWDKPFYQRIGERLGWLPIGAQYYAASRKNS